MSYLIAEPRIVAAAAAEVAGIGSAVSTAGAAAAGPTCALAVTQIDDYFQVRFDQRRQRWANDRDCPQRGQQRQMLGFNDVVRVRRRALCRQLRGRRYLCRCEVRIRGVHREYPEYCVDIGQDIEWIPREVGETVVLEGYGDPRFGYSTSPANVPTPFGLFPDVPASVVADALVAGTQQGVNDFMVELPAALNTLPQTPMPAFPPYVPTLLPPPPPPQPATLINIADTFASVVSTGYSILLPTADLGLAFVTILPAYDLTLFVNQLAAGNLRAAIELPLAATIGLAALGGMIEFIAIVVTLADITQQLQSFSI